MLPRCFRLLELDLRSLAAFRVGLALALGTDLAVRAYSLREHYSDSGAWPRGSQQLLYIAPHPGRWSLHLLGGSCLYQATLFLLAAACAALLLVGYRTRVAHVLSFLLLISLQNRNEEVLTGADTLLRLICFWGMFLPLGARLSCDARRGRLPPWDDAQRVAAPASIGSFALMLQLSGLYLVSALLKTGPEWRSDFSALHYALHLQSLETSVGAWLRGFPEVSSWLTRWAIGVEFALPLVVFVPGTLAAVFLPAKMACFVDCSRALAVLGAWLFHGFLALTLAIGIFPLVGIVAWSGLIPTRVWEHIPWRPAAKAPVRSVAAPRAAQVLWNGGAAVCLALAVVGTSCELRGRDFKSWLPDDLFGYVSLRAINALRLEQRWGLFAPSPQKDDGYFVFQGRHSDGTVVNLLRPEEPFSWEKPALVSSSYGTFRRRKFLTGLSWSDGVERRRSYARYLCDTWNEKPSDHGPLQSLVMSHVSRTTLARGGYSPSRRTRLHAEQCLPTDPVGPAPHGPR